MVPASGLGRTSLGDQGTWSSSVNQRAQVGHFMSLTTTNQPCVRGGGGDALIEPWFHFCF